MIRRNTIIIFVAFLVLLVGILYINYDSNLQTTLGMQTATPTDLPKLTNGFNFGAMNKIVIKSAASDGPNYELNLIEKGKWVTSKNEPVSLVAIYQFVLAMSNMKSAGRLDGSTPLDKIGLDPAQNEILLTDTDGNHANFKIGGQTATRSNNYVTWNNSTINMVSSDDVSNLLQVFTPETLFEPTPTPGSLATPEITPTGSK